MELLLVKAMWEIRNRPKMGDIILALKLTQGSKPKHSYPGFMYATFMMTAERKMRLFTIGQGI